MITDVCFCEYTDHGHCGPLTETGGRVDVDNDATLPLLAEQAVSHARAGADVVAPSGMMDGMVGAIRAGLDGAGFASIPILSYAAKFASGYYGPFRDAAESAPAFGDRRTYQMDPANGDEALREVGPRPGRRGRHGDGQARRWPTSTSSGGSRSGSASRWPPTTSRASTRWSRPPPRSGWIDERRVVLETLTGFKRAGADMIITYHAPDVARWLRQG